jgi:hypothetical protein
MATAIEYGLITALVGVVIVSAVVAATDRPGNEQAPTQQTPTYERVEMGSGPTSPILVSTSEGEWVECPEGYRFAPRARPIGEPEAYACIVDTSPAAQP